MEKLNINIKKLVSNAKIPKYAKPGDAGMDITSVTKSVETDPHGSKTITYGTGLAFEIPEGYVGLLFPRSSVYKQGQRLTNSVGVVDSSYRGEIMFKYRQDVDVRLKDAYHSPFEYDVGERVGQIVIMPYPQVEFNEVDELSDTDRGEGGFGSTGK
tara:strand:+ start:329 stop:796 length:468 start_codon:yes stop_codon:yes gene_type:complete